MGATHDKADGGLNEAQIHHLLASFRHIDGLLKNIEGILDCTQSRSPFPRYQLDIDPQLRLELENQIRTLRGALVSILLQQSIPVPPPSISALHAVGTAADFVELAIDELRPKQMRAYGKLANGTPEVLNGIVDQLEQMAVDMMRTVKNGGKQVA
jgi:hypothetical protein